MSSLVQSLESALRQGPRPLADLLPRLGISRHAFGRLVRGHPHRSLRIGARKTARYALARSIPGVASPVPVFEWGHSVTEAPRHLLNLIPIEPRGFAVLPAEGGPATAYDDLPWFLHDHRPRGFLGRQIPRLYPDLHAPDDIRLWSADDVLRYATTVASSPPGSLVVGRAPLLISRHFQAPSAAAPTVAALLPLLAQRVEANLHAPTAGSSAAGEQPKLLATLTPESGPVDLIVKYSPPLGTAVGRRTADLLIAEHIAGEVIHQHHPGWAALSEVHTHANRVWLLSHRFDRTASGGRVGCVSLEAVNAELTGVYPRRWSIAARELASQKLLSRDDVARIEWLEAFGWGIGNTDMHFGNLTLGLRGTTINGVRPIYDMLPMAWMPRHGEVPRVSDLRPAPADLSSIATEAIRDFWTCVAMHADISQPFRTIAETTRSRPTKHPSPVPTPSADKTARRR